RQCLDRVKFESGKGDTIKADVAARLRQLEEGIFATDSKEFPQMVDQAGHQQWDDAVKNALSCSDGIAQAKQFAVLAKLMNPPKQAFPSPATPTRPTLDWFDRLPKRDKASIAEERHDDIPDEKKFADIVRTPRFERMLNETASMVANPHRIAICFKGPP